MIFETEFERLINEFHMILSKSKFGMNSPYARGKIIASLRNYKNEIVKREWAKGFWVGFFTFALAWFLADGLWKLLAYLSI